MPNAHLLQPRFNGRARSPSEIIALERERKAWLGQLDPRAHFHRIFDCIPGVEFFAKDRFGRAMFVSCGILQRYQMQDEREMLGLTDFDINPASMAANPSSPA